jgi:uncharacterized protein YdeI (YjbR/CyaY-like superfamily)
MSAAVSHIHDPRSSTDPSRPAVAVVVPVELATLFEESEKAKATYDRLDDRDRRGFVKYIELATTTTARERRAAIVATSLLGLAVSFGNDLRS